MALADIVFWIILMVLAFVGFLGLQMRYFAGVALKIYLGDRLKQASQNDVQAVILHAVGGRRSPPLDGAALIAEAEHLRRAHPRPLQLIRLGRTLSLIVPFTMALLLVAWRFSPL